MKQGQHVPSVEHPLASLPSSTQLEVHSSEIPSAGVCLCDLFISPLCPTPTCVALLDISTQTNSKLKERLILRPSRTFSLSLQQYFDILNIDPEQASPSHPLPQTSCIPPLNFVIGGRS